MPGTVAAETEERGLRIPRCVRATGRRPLGWQEAPRLVDGVGRADKQGLPGLASCTSFRMQWEPLKAFEQNYLMGKSPWLSCAGWVGEQG